MMRWNVQINQASRFEILTKSEESSWVHLFSISTDIEISHQSRDESNKSKSTYKTTSMTYDER